MGTIQQDLNYRCFVDEVSSALIYVGYSEEGTPEDSNGWVLYKLETTGTVTKQLTVDGLLNPTSRWDLRATYTYL